MTITEIKSEYVFATLQKLSDGEILYCADFGRGELIDTYGLTVGQIARKIQSDTCKFFKVTKE